MKSRRWCISSRDYDAGERVECTYIEIEQVAHTYAVVLSKPAWLWGAEMGANEHQVCIGNEAVWGRESADGNEALLGMDLVRIGLERANAAEEAVDVITELLEKYGQGGSCMEDESNFTYHNSFLISDRKEAWLLETSGKHWAAERVKGGYRNISNQYSITTKIDKEHPALREYAQSQGWWDGETRFNFSTVYSFMTTARIEASGSRYCEGKKLLKKSNGHITAETMMDILRDKDSGINMEGTFLTTGSMVSVIPTNQALPGVHYFTATPDPERSVFKPFIFVKNVNELKETSSPSYGADDPVKKKPRFQSKPDRKHLLFVKHELVAAALQSSKDKGKKITESMRKLEKDKMTEMEKILSNGIEEPDLLADLFTRSVREEMAVYGKS
uniref:Secernin 3 n=1 Tax=Cyclopterus lumpus TaxID=8103 RepID=A0A8C3ARL8_CYCLU